MTFNCSKWILSSLLLALSSALLLGQSATPATPTPSPEKKDKEKYGYFRLWNMLPNEAGELNIVQEDGKEGEVLVSGPPTNFAARYVPIKVGRYNLRITRTDDPKTPLKTFDVVLRENVYVSFLAQVKDKALSIEMIDDTYDATTALTGKLTVRHFIPGAKITVSLPGGSSTGTLAEGGMAVLENIQPNAYLVKMEAAFADGKTRSWSSPVDFRATRHASVLLAMDPNGRFRPRVTMDGQSILTEP